ncbi:hypothetical protein ACVST5_15670 [Yersinia enterocolitica]
MSLFERLDINYRKITIMNIKRWLLSPIIGVVFFINTAFAALQSVTLERTSEWKYTVSVQYPLETGWKGSVTNKWFVQRGGMVFDIRDKNNGTFLGATGSWDLSSPCVMTTSLSGNMVAVRSPTPTIDSGGTSQSQCYTGTTANNLGWDGHYYIRWVNPTVTGTIRSYVKPEFELTNVNTATVSPVTEPVSITRQDIAPAQSESVTFSYFPQLSFDKVGANADVGYLIGSSSSCMNYNISMSPTGFVNISSSGQSNNKLCANDRLVASVQKLPPTYGDMDVNVTVNLSLP